MPSSTSNVKLGVCKVYYDGIDLGYTKGGVEVSVSTETHEVNIDQFGKTAINQLVTGREIKVKVPMAETTVENMVRIMPGATATYVGGTKASKADAITFSANPSADSTIVIGGSTIKFKSSNPVALKNEVLIGVDAPATVVNLIAHINASLDPNLAKITASQGGTTSKVTITYDEYGVDGNSFTIVAGTGSTNATLLSPLAGGVDPTGKRVDVMTGIGTDLLSSAKELRLHPFGKGDFDYSDDFVIPRAGTGGSLSFAFKTDDERVFNVEFTGYADSNGKLFIMGDKTIPTA